MQKLKKLDMEKIKDKKKLLLAGILAFFSIFVIIVFVTRDSIDNKRIQIRGYRHLSATLTKKKEITDSEIEKAVQDTLIERGIVRKIKNRKIENGDTVTISFQELSPNRDGMRRKNYHLKIGSNTFLKEFEQALIGKKVGKTYKIKFKFPKDYQNAQYVGQKAIFKVKVYEITENYTKETLTDEVLKADGKYQSVKQFYEEKSKELEKEKNKEFQKQKEEAMWKALLKQTKLKQYRPYDLNQEANLYEQEYEKNAQALGISLEEFVVQFCDKSIEDYQKEKRKAGKEALKKKMAIQAIAKKEHIKKDKEQKVKELLLKHTTFVYAEDQKRDLKKKNQKEKQISKKSSEHATIKQ